MTKQLRNTRLIELVETHNIYLSMRRLSQVNEWGNGSKKRALYHAICMCGSFDTEMMKNIRIALELP